MMSAASIIQILFSIVLSSAAQALMKAGMMSPGVVAAVGGGRPMEIVLAVAMSPTVLMGLGCFGLSAAVWLMVLARVDLSQAYPFVALGIVVTVATAILWFGEPVSVLRLAGVGLVAAGVILVALG